MELFAEKNVSPMLIAEMKDAFDDPDWIYELKLDGCRCVAYLEDGMVTLRNKRNKELLPRFPELTQIHKQAKKRCILDGELVVLSGGKPDFYELQKRTLMTDRFKIELGVAKLPASFIAYDCLQVGDRVLLDVPLMERKDVLADLIAESDRFAVSRFIPEKGIDLFQMTVHVETVVLMSKVK